MRGMDAFIVPAVLAVVALALVAKSVVVVPNGKAFVIGRLGRAERMLPPGLHLVVPFINTVIARLPAGVQELDVAPGAGELRDGTGVAVRGTIRYRVTNAVTAINDVADYRQALPQLARTHWLNALAQADLNTARDLLPAAVPHMQTAARTWGIEIDSATPLLDFSDDAVAALRVQAQEARHVRVREWLAARGEAPRPGGVPTAAQDAAYEAWATAPADSGVDPTPEMAPDSPRPASGPAGLRVAVARATLASGASGPVEIDGRERLARNTSSGVIQPGFRCVVEGEDGDALLVRPL